MSWPRTRRAGDHYTASGIRRLKCIRCEIRPAVYEWSICADGNIPRQLCTECDVKLNEMVLRWARDPDVEAKIEAYKRRAQ